MLAFQIFISTKTKKKFLILKQNFDLPTDRKVNPLSFCKLDHLVPKGIFPHSRETV
jgi:hypothetical protein